VAGRIQGEEEGPKGKREAACGTVAAKKKKRKTRIETRSSLMSGEGDRQRN